MSVLDNVNVYKYSKEIIGGIVLFAILYTYLSFVPVTKYSDKKSYSSFKTKPPTENFSLYEDFDSEYGYDNKKDNPILISMVLLALILLLLHLFSFKTPSIFKRHNLDKNYF
jgi:CDP-diglyceride synthetase